MTSPTPKHYWLVAGRVVTADSSGKEYEKGLNTLLATDHCITRMDLAKAQQGLQLRFVKEAKQVPGRKIVDVYIQAVSFLGLMTEEIFHAGFSAENVEKSAKELN